MAKVATGTIFLQVLWQGFRYLLKLAVLVFAWCTIGTGHVLIKGGKLILKLVKK